MLKRDRTPFWFDVATNQQPASVLACHERINSAADTRPISLTQAEYRRYPPEYE